MNNEYVLFPIEALAHHVIPCLTREPVVCSNVGDLRVYSSGSGDLRVYSSGSRIKSGMTITDSLD